MLVNYMHYVTESSQQPYEIGSIINHPMFNLKELRGVKDHAQGHTESFTPECHDWTYVGADERNDWT